MRLTQLRKLDYIIFYVIFSVIFIGQLIDISFIAIGGILIVCIMPALILGTITNLIFNKNIRA